MRNTKLRTDNGVAPLNTLGFNASILPLEQIELLSNFADVRFCHILALVQNILDR
jgi:hypothetical protein